MHEDDVDLCDGELVVDGEEEDINFVDDGSKLDAETQRFDRIVGALEEVLLDEEFEELRESFCRENCQHFEDSDENKLIYTDIFSKYTSLVESTIDQRLKQAVPGFSMQEFMGLLESHKDSLMSDVFDLLLSLADFEAFKEVMLSYKRDLADGPGFAINCTPLRLHTEEQEDGEARPDLDLSLQISPIGGSGPKAGAGLR
ncbi:hypothetical protein CHLRE_19g751247v5 [Chlamydomonas reinhardtii]|uniref:ADP-ribosylation factor-like protein 2-binding protein n=1 Tax=Chlamydomonas reinhardtii TaxID=3055 RepID=A0A2K3CNF5_CHLRE|nr:uncharacterized protein CHLRE_19g751247v5 [Chlamydomonas reinhardtii]PNW69822.1 hypothetical protein CHLRE_19g751247v5 [Chlamydomonas reinhardtii]